MEGSGGYVGDWKKRKSKRERLGLGFGVLGEESV